MQFIGVLTGVAFAIEVLVKFLRSGFDPHDRVPAAWWIALAVGAGLVTAFAFDLNLFRDHSPVTRFSDAVGKVYTGLALGGGSGVLHALLTRLNMGSVSNPKGLAPPPKKSARG